jgi:hypothetical protein
MENELNVGTETYQGNKERLTRDIGGMVNQASEVIKDYGTRKLATAKETLSQAQSVVSDTASSTRMSPTSTCAQIHGRRSVWRLLQGYWSASS